MFRKVKLAAFLLVASATQAGAWDAKVEGPDVFGVTKVLALEDGPRGSLVVQCDSKENLFIAFIFRKKEFEEVPSGPASLYIQATASQPLKLDAEVREWNDNYAGVVASGRDSQLMFAIKEIQNARSKVNVGIELYGTQESATLGSRGSTKAMDKVIEGCKLGDIALPPA